MFILTEPITESLLSRLSTSYPDGLARTIKLAVYDAAAYEAFREARIPRIQLLAGSRHGFLLFPLEISGMDVNSELLGRVDRRAEEEYRSWIVSSSSLNIRAYDTLTIADGHLTQLRGHAKEVFVIEFENGEWPTVGALLSAAEITSKHAKHYDLLSTNCMFYSTALMRALSSHFRGTPTRPTKKKAHDFLKALGIGTQKKAMDAILEEFGVNMKDAAKPPSEFTKPSPSEQTSAGEAAGSSEPVSGSHLSQGTGSPDTRTPEGFERENTPRWVHERLAAGAERAREQGDAEEWRRQQAGQKRKKDERRMAEEKGINYGERVRGRADDATGLKLSESRQLDEGERGHLTPTPRSRAGDASSMSKQSDRRRTYERPKPTRPRIWHDRTGQYKVLAEFVGYQNGNILLHKINGVVIQVPSEKMSLEDVAFIPLNPGSHWLSFFFDAGCDVYDCTLYAAAFEHNKIDETILIDIKPEALRALGVRESDIYRVINSASKQRVKGGSLPPAGDKVGSMISTDIKPETMGAFAVREEGDVNPAINIAAEQPVKGGSSPDAALCRQRTGKLS